MSDTPTLNVPKDLIEPVIREHVAGAVCKALGDHETLVREAIAAVLGMRVDSDGRPSRYNSERDKTWLEWAMRDCVMKSAKDAIEEFLGKEKALIKEQIGRELRKKNSVLARQLIRGMVEGLTTNLKYRLTVKVEER